MNEQQKQFFAYFAVMQESCVQACMAEHRCFDEQVKSMLYDVTYSMTVKMMEMIDGYSALPGSKLNVTNTVTGRSLKEMPFIELHDCIEEFLRSE